MNEEQLADLLTEHLDALLSGETPAAAPPVEVAHLLSVAPALTQVAPSPRPEFGPALKARLLPGNGSTPPTGSALGGSTITLVVVGVLILTGLVGLVITLNLAGLTRSGAEPASPSTPSFPATATNSATPAPTPATATPIIEATAAPAVTATMILDILPPITATVGLEDGLLSPPDLVPGPSGGGGGENDNGNGGKGEGDHDKGHGNDEDHDDEDNPGGGGKK